jgi:hypothetical protein
MSSSSLDSEWVFALNDAARNCEIRQQSRMSHRGGNVMTWAEPQNLSPIGESVTPSVLKIEMPLGRKPTSSLPLPVVSRSFLTDCF